MNKNRSKGSVGGDKKSAFKFGANEINKLNTELKEGADKFPDKPEMTDEQLGLEVLQEIMPDTWKNISWVIINAV